MLLEDTLSDSHSITYTVGSLPSYSLVPPVTSTPAAIQQKNSSKSTNDCCVQVAVRVRPFVSMELVNCESSCVKTRGATSVGIGKDKEFEFDKVIDQFASQEDVYECCMRDLLTKSFEGYNATVLAYGQTGSGKTHTMGTSNVSLNDADDMGILPRVIREIFRVRRENEQTVQMLLKISYFEIYNDNIIDLLDDGGTSSSSSGAGTCATGRQSIGGVTNRRVKNNGGGNVANVFIREEVDGSINLYGITEEKVNSPEEMLAALERGGNSRSTSATLMNSTSSRSHAVFTIFLEQHELEVEGGEQNEQSGDGFKTSKLHFVDLAGSERLKRTGAVGATMKEGININMGLLSLGNVISALTEPGVNGRRQHIPYRDSKLTRILQDSLGGNSNTLMIACVSPAESNFEESLNTLKYASRARRIKNKPVVNRDPQSALISALKEQVEQAMQEIQELKGLLETNGIDVPITKNTAITATAASGIKKPLNGVNGKQDDSMSGCESVLVMQEELKNLRVSVIKYEKKVKELTGEIDSIKLNANRREIEVLTIQRERDYCRLNVERIEGVLKERGLEDIVVALNRSNEGEDAEESVNGEKSRFSLVDEYREEIEKLRRELQEKEECNRQLQLSLEEALKVQETDNQMLVEREKTIRRLNTLLRDEKQKQVQFNHYARGEKDDSDGENEIGNRDDDDDDNDVLDEDDLAKMQCDPEFVQMENACRQQESQRKLKMQRMDGSLSDSNVKMRKMASEQVELQSRLLSQMKEQYHAKISGLEADMRRMEGQRDDALNKLGSNVERSKVVETYRLKVADMQDRLTEFKRKAREQELLQRTVSSQEKQISALGSEIAKFKSAKAELAKEIKRNAEEFEKFKQKKSKDIMAEKKRGIQRDRQIFRLQNQNKRQDRMLAKKAQDIKALVRAKDLIQKIVAASGGSGSNLKGKMKVKSSRKQQQAIESVDEAIEDNEIGECGRIVDQCLSRLIESIEVQRTVAKAEEELQLVQVELEEVQSRSIELKLALERKTSRNSDDYGHTEQSGLSSDRLECEEMQSRLESIEANYEFKRVRLDELYADEAAKQYSQSVDLLLTGSAFNTLVKMKMIVQCLLERFGKSAAEVLRLTESSERLTVEVADQQEFVKFLQSSQENQAAQMQGQIAELESQIRQMMAMATTGDSHVEFSDDENGTGIMLSSRAGRMNQPQQQHWKGSGSVKYKSTQLAHQLEHSPQKTSNSNAAAAGHNLKIIEEQVKQLTKNNHELTKQLKQQEKRIKTMQDRNDVLQLKYDDKKKTNCKDKFVGVSKQLGDEEGFPSPPSLSQMLFFSNMSNNGNNHTNADSGGLLANSQISETGFDITTSINTPIQSTLKSNTSGTNHGKDLISLKERRSIVKSKHDDMSSPGLHAMTETREEKLSALDKQMMGVVDFQLKPRVSLLSQKRSQYREVKQQNLLSSQLGVGHIGQSLGGGIQLFPANTQSSSTWMDGALSSRGRMSVGANPNLSLHKKAHRESISMVTIEDSAIAVADGIDERCFSYGQSDSYQNSSESPLRLSDHNPFGSSSFQTQPFSPTISDDLSMYVGGTSHDQTNMINEGTNHGNGSLISHRGGGGGGGGSSCILTARSSCENNSSSTSCKYECVGKISEAHSGQVFCVESHENKLYSTSEKSLKIWDVESLKCIKDMQVHTRFVKGLTLFGNAGMTHKWVATACDKYINVWDMLSMEKICMLTGHNSDIKQLRVDESTGNVLYSAGKGANNAGALVTWDVRKQSVIEEREKNQDIFAVLPYNNVLYYASRDHYVRRINMETNATMDPFQPPHYDAVTSLAALNGYLVSGSKDKNLKLWQTNGSSATATASITAIGGGATNNSSSSSNASGLKQQTYYSNDQVNCLASNLAQNLVYVGQKDGKVKVVTTAENGKFKDVADISNGKSSVNCVARVASAAVENVFATGSADKVIKIWKPTWESQGYLSTLLTSNDGYIDSE